MVQGIKKLLGTFNIGGKFSKRIAMHSLVNAIISNSSSFHFLDLYLSWIIVQKHIS